MDYDYISELADNEVNNIQGLASVKGDMHKILIDLLGLIVIDFRPFSFLGSASGEIYCTLPKPDRAYMAN